MRRAIFFSMWLTLWRDRAAFALAFVLPPIIFAIFAAVFAPAASGDLSIRLSVVAGADDVSRALVDGMANSDLISHLEEDATVEDLKNRLRLGEADAGVEVIREDPTIAPLFRIYADPMKKNAATLAEAALAAQAPPEAFGDVSPAEHVTLAADGSVPIAAYFAAGVSMLFIFLSGFQSSLTIIEERDAGVTERIAAGPLGVRPMIDAKFVFLFLQASAQILLIFLTGMLAFNIPTPSSWLLFLVVVAAASFCSAGVCLAITGFCRSRAQAHAIGAVLSLVAGALGGSMAPRFLMSPEIRSIGAATPHAWGIDAFSAVFWRGGEAALVWTPCAFLIIAGGIGLATAHLSMPASLRAR